MPVRITHHSSIHVSLVTIIYQLITPHVACLNPTRSPRGKQVAEARYRGVAIGRSTHMPAALLPRVSPVGRGSTSHTTHVAERNFVHSYFDYGPLAAPHISRSVPGSIAKSSTTNWRFASEHCNQTSRTDCNVHCQWQSHAARAATDEVLRRTRTHAAPPRSSRSTTKASRPLFVRQPTQRPKGLLCWWGRERPPVWLTGRASINVDRSDPWLIGA